MKNIFILLVTFISFFLASGWAVAQQSRTDVKIDGMYFSYYSNKNEVVKLQFNIAGKNVSEIELYVKYKYKGQGGGFKTANIKCSSTDLGTRNDYPIITTNCSDSANLIQYLMGDTKVIRLKKRSASGVITNLQILKYIHKESFYQQLKKNSSHSIEDHIVFMKEEKIKANIRVAIAKEELQAKAAKDKAERAAKAAKEKAERAAKAAKEKAERAAKATKEKADRVARAAKEKAEREAKAAKDKIERNAKAKIEKKAKAKAAKERVKRESIAKVERDIIKKEKMERELKLKIELEKWNRKDEVKLFLYDIKTFVIANPSKLDNRKLIKLLKPIKDIDRQKLTITSKNIILINNLAKFLFLNVDFYTFRQNNVSDRDNAKMLVLENEIKSKLEAEARAKKVAQEEAIRAAEIKALQDSKELEEKEFILSFIKIKMKIITDFMSDLVDNDPFNDNSYDLLILLENYNEKVDNSPNSLNEQDLDILLKGIRKLSLYKDYESYLFSYKSNDTEYDKREVRFNLIKKNKKETLLTLKNEKKAKSKLIMEAKLKADLKAKAQLDLEAKVKAENEAKAIEDRAARSKSEREIKAKADREARAKIEKQIKAKAGKELKAEREAQGMVDREFIRNGNYQKLYGKEQKFMSNLISETLRASRGKTQAMTKRLWIEASRELCGSNTFSARREKKDWIGKLVEVNMDDKGEVDIKISIENKNMLSDYKVPEELIDSILSIELGDMSFWGYAKNGPLVKFSGSFRLGNMNESECLDAGFTASPELIDETFSFDIKKLELIKFY
jgi:hypothetical protein